MKNSHYILGFNPTKDDVQKMKDLKKFLTSPVNARVTNSDVLRFAIYELHKNIFEKK